MSENDSLISTDFVEVVSLPKVGQFVAVWVYNNRVWSSTFRWSEHGTLERYNEEEDRFEELCERCKEVSSQHPSRWFVARRLPSDSQEGVPS